MPARQMAARASLNLSTTVAKSDVSLERVLAELR